jgi:hypothetical protein
MHGNMRNAYKSLVGNCREEEETLKNQALMGE